MRLAIDSIILHRPTRLVIGSKVILPRRSDVHARFVRELVRALLDEVQFGCRPEELGEGGVVGYEAGLGGQGGLGVFDVAGVCARGVVGC